MMQILLPLMLLLAIQDGEESAFKKNAALFAKKCSKCHTVGQGDRVGPDLKGVTEKRDRKWLVGFLMNPDEYLDSDPMAQELLKKYGGVRMTNEHLTREEAKGLLDYVEARSKGPAVRVTEVPLERRDLAKEAKGPVEPGGVSVLGIGIVVVMLVFSTLLWTQGWSRAGQVLGVLSLGVLYWSLGGSGHHRLIGDHQGYEPDQPIAYSHKLHAGELGISCMYCHHGAEKGPRAGVPSVNVCMNCHSVVKVEGSTELQKLEDIWAKREEPDAPSIEWVRVHRVPDFVTFNHKAHVQNGLLCQTCHGPVQEMEKIRQVSNLSMGWCVNCHRHDGFDPPTHWKRAEGTLDCTACHQ